MSIRTVPPLSSQQYRMKLSRVGRLRCGTYSISVSLREDLVISLQAIWEARWGGSTNHRANTYA